MVETPVVEVRTASEELVLLAGRNTRNLPSCAVKQKVRSIINRVRNQGDKAILDFTRWIDKIHLTQGQLKIPVDSFKEAYSQVSKEHVLALEELSSKLRIVSEKMLERISFSLDIEGTNVENTYRPLRDVGCYVPGGEAAYPSSLLMCAIPAQVAGVRRIVVCTPPKSEGVHALTLVAADMCGVKEVYQVGGAQAIAALAYGTETISPVQKIVGPGNMYVAEAKKVVAKQTLIDMPAGPSEVLVIADETASVSSIALDMISQAEHGADAVSVLVATSKELCNSVAGAITALLPASPRKEIIEASLKKNGGIYYLESLEECIQFANLFGAEHLQIMTSDAREVSNQIESAGVILLGNYTPVAASDYGLGVNHVLPTQGFSATCSGLSVLDFVRIVRIAESTKTALEPVADSMCVLAEAEGLENHARAIRGRFET